MEPHDHGVLNGSLQLLGFQIAGSSSRPLPNRIRIKVEEMADQMLEKHLPVDGLQPPANTFAGTSCSFESNPPTESFPIDLTGFKLALRAIGNINSLIRVAVQNVLPSICAFESAARSS